MKLREGFMTTEEIAKWFGCKNVRTLSGKNEKYGHRYGELIEYCEFIKVKGGFNIIKILDPDCVVYEKQSIEARRYVQTNYRKHWNNPDTATRVASALFVEKPEKLKVSYSTIYRLVKEYKNIEYGKGKGKDKSKELYGTLGTCDQVWSKLIGRLGQDVSFELKAKRRYEKLTDDELDLIYKRFGEWYQGLRQAVLDTQQDVAEGKITKQEAWDVLTERAKISDVSYQEFLSAVSNEIKCNWIIKATELKDGAVPITQLPKEGEFDF